MLTKSDMNAGPLAQAKQRINQWDPHIHAFVTVMDVNEEGADMHSGPLAGLTVGIKDIIDVAGLPTRNGSDACLDAKPASCDAPVVAALRAAGASIVGKTTTTEFAFTDPTPCRNPHDLRRSPGGSSSGSGAAVAAGLVDIALGTQTAGSLCRPAAYCGAVGFKPSAGVLSMEGVTPLAHSFDAVGIIAGSVEKAQIAFEAMSPECANSGNLEKARVTATSGLWKTDVAPQQDAIAALRDAELAATGSGVHLTAHPLEADVDAIVDAHRVVMTSEAATAHAGMLRGVRAKMLKQKFAAGLRAGMSVSRDALVAAKQLLAQEKTAFWTGMSEIDVVITLPVPEGPPLMDGTTGYQDWLTPWTVFGGPLVCLPWGLDGLGRPRSVMLAAHPGQDAWLLAFAGMLEACAPDLPAPKLPTG
ncbi:MAG: amidase [Paracoccaceae bacterium]|nr:amidase [Paracoccaceae bacterium]